MMWFMDLLGVQLPQCQKKKLQLNCFPSLSKYVKILKTNWEETPHKNPGLNFAKKLRYLHVWPYFSSAITNARPKKGHSTFKLVIPMPATWSQAIWRKPVNHVPNTCGLTVFYSPTWRQPENWQNGDFAWQAGIPHIIRIDYIDTL